MFMSEMCLGNVLGVYALSDRLKWLIPFFASVSKELHKNKIALTQPCSSIKT
jgi:hypothetical protein